MAFTRRYDRHVILPVPSGTYGIDAMHSQLGFAVRHLGISTVRGTFDAYSGSLTIADGLDGVSVTVEATTASVNSGNRMRDNHLHIADYFDVENHPTLRFTSSSVTAAEAGSDGYVLTGDLTIKGVTKPVRLDVTFNGSGVFPVDQSTHYGFTGTGTIKRSDFGVGPGGPILSDDVALQLDAQFIAPAAAPPTTGA